MQRQVRFNRVPEIPEKVPGSPGAKPSQVQQVQNSALCIWCFVFCICAVKIVDGLLIDRSDLCDKLSLHMCVVWQMSCWRFSVTCGFVSAACWWLAAQDWTACQWQIIMRKLVNYLFSSVQTKTPGLHSTRWKSQTALSTMWKGYAQKNVVWDIGDMFILLLLSPWNQQQQ